MLAYLKAIVLAVIEGATEFIPVSSTGHLIIADEYIKLSENEAFAKTFMVVIQLPAILAVVVYFWSELWPFAKDPGERHMKFRLWTRIVVAFLPAAFFGFLLDDFIEEKLFNSVVVATALIVGGIVLIVLERRRPSTTILTVYDIGFRTALYIGLFQCLAMLPGTSRSAATIIGAMLLGATRPAAAEFSFFLAIPTMLGATVFKLGQLGAGFTVDEWSIIAVASVVSFAVAYSVVAVFMSYIQRRDFRPFGYYRIVLGIVVLIHYYWISTAS
ncbi:MAG: undecaprenyl-diphosphate phosphatase [FCB group bacterium]|nr:undecaprenyl-diphosphate phosphatase [FCB group bacterium]